MRHFIAISLSTALLSTAGYAQKVSIFPKDHTSQEGIESSNVGPLSRGVNRSLFLYDSSKIDMPTGSDITKVGFRQDGESALAAGFRLQIEIFMGVSSLTPSAAKTRLKDNYDGDRTTVLTKRVVDLPAFAKPVAPPSTNLVLLALDKPFKHDAKKNLVLEYVVFANTNQNRTFVYPMDFARYLRPLDSFGAGCKGSNDKAAVLTSKTASSGVTWRLDITSGLPATAALVAIGDSKDKLFGTVPLPLALDGLGAVGCNLYVDMAFLLVTATDTRGNASILLPMPDLVGLYGTTFYAQAILADVFANSLGLTTTNAASVYVHEPPQVARVTRANASNDGAGFVDRMIQGQLLTAFEYR